MSKKTAARIAVRESLIELVATNQQFRDAVQNDATLPLWLMTDPASGIESDISVLAQREQLSRAVTQLTYTDLQNKQETVRLTGLVGISAETYDIGIRLNDVRQQFKVAISAFRKLFGDDVAAIEQASEDLREGVLGGLHVQHLHFVQCYRQLKLFQQAPNRVGFSWAACHSGTVRLTAQAAIAHLENKYLASAAIQEDIIALNKMAQDEVVVIRRELAPHLRANITWSKAIQTLRASDATLRKQYPAQINSPLPLFIQLEQGQPLPEFNLIRPFDPSAKQARLTRSDAKLVKINDNPHSKIYSYA